MNRKCRFWFFIIFILFFIFGQSCGTSSVISGREEYKKVKKTAFYGEDSLILTDTSWILTHDKDNLYDVIHFYPDGKLVYEYGLKEEDEKVYRGTWERIGNVVKYIYVDKDNGNIYFFKGTYNSENNSLYGEIERFSRRNKLERINDDREPLIISLTYASKKWLAINRKPPDSIVRSQDTFLRSHDSFESSKRLNFYIVTFHDYIYTRNGRKDIFSHIFVNADSVAEAEAAAIRQWNDKYFFSGNYKYITVDQINAYR